MSHRSVSKANTSPSTWFPLSTRAVPTRRALHRHSASRIQSQAVLAAGSLALLALRLPRHSPRGNPAPSPPVRAPRSRRQVLRPRPVASPLPSPDLLRLSTAPSLPLPFARRHRRPLCPAAAHPEEVPPPPSPPQALSPPAAGRQLSPPLLRVAPLLGGAGTLPTGPHPPQARPLPRQPPAARLAWQPGSRAPH